MNDIVKILFLFLLILILIISSGFILPYYYSFPEGNVALVRIDSGFMTSSDSDNIIYSLNQIMLNPNIEAIIFSINNNDSSIVANQEVSDYINKLNITTIAWIREECGNNSFIIANSTDFIIANEYSLIKGVNSNQALNNGWIDEIGGINEINSYLNVSDFLTIEYGS